MLLKQKIVLIADIHKELHSRYHDFLVDHFDVHILEEVSFGNIKEAITTHNPSIIILDEKIKTMKSIIQTLNQEHKNIPVLVLSNEFFIENNTVYEINREEFENYPNVVCVIQKENIHPSQLPSLIAQVIDNWERST